MSIILGFFPISRMTCLMLLRGIWRNADTNPHLELNGILVSSGQVCCARLVLMFSPVVSIISVNLAGLLIMVLLLVIAVLS